MENNIQDSLPIRLNQEVKIFWRCSFTELLWSFGASAVIAILLTPIFIMAFAAIGINKLSFSFSLAVFCVPIIFYKIAKTIPKITEGRHKGYFTEFCFKHLPIKGSYFDLDGKLTNKRYL